MKPSNSGSTYYFEDINLCPICKHNISPNYIESYLHSENTKLSLYCECTSCYQPFLVLLSNLNTIDAKKTFKTIEYSVPYIHTDKVFDSHIENLSKNFSKIYNEALTAEELKLNNICGIGYRKSLEFLIKDYSINSNSDFADKIKSMPLSQVISEYIHSDNIKNLAKASTWIGNDETHYVRIFQDKDITDLKKFIDATVAYITYELISEEATLMVESK